MTNRVSLLRDTFAGCLHLLEQRRTTFTGQDSGLPVLSCITWRHHFAFPVPTRHLGLILLPDFCHPVVLPPEGLLESVQGLATAAAARQPCTHWLYRGKQAQKSLSTAPCGSSDVVEDRLSDDRDISPAASVHPSAWLGAGVSVGPFCIIGPDVRIGAGTRLLGNNVVVTTCPVCPGCLWLDFSSSGKPCQMCLSLSLPPPPPPLPTTPRLTYTHTHTHTRTCVWTPMLL